MRIDSCSSPRPTTFICSGVSVSSTRSDTLPSSSFSSRSRRLREVTYWPSRPATGDVLTPKIIDTVGSSTAIGGMAMRCSWSAIVSPIVMSSMPARQIDVARRGLADLDPLEAVEREQLGDLRVLERAIELDDRDRVVQLHGAVEDAADGDAPEIVAGVEVGDEHLQRRRRIAAAAAARARRWRRRAAADPRPWSPISFEATAFAGVGVEHRELDLILGGVEIDEEVVDLVQHFLRPRVGAVDLVQHDDGRQPALERLPQHEPRLRQRALRRRPRAA